MNEQNENRQLTLQEKWDIDNEALAKAPWKIETPQCKMCKYIIPASAYNCLQYELPDQKPKYVFHIEKECPKFEHKDIMAILPESKYEEQLLGGILGFAVGDALGVPAEFTSREEREKDPVLEMRAYGTYDQYFGTWSDDTSMTLCLVESLQKGYELHDIAEKFCKFYYEAYWTPNNEVFDIGATTVHAIERMKQGINPVECGGSSEKDNGNGSLMRVLPLAFYLRHTDVQRKIKTIEEVSSLTHAHPRSKLACIIYVEFAMNLLDHDKQNAYENTIEFIKEYCATNYSAELKNFDRILDNDLIRIDERDIRSSGYVIDSLEAAMWTFVTTDNYQDAVFKAINLGGDTDTIAALAGGLAGIHYGVNSISNNWIQCLARKHDIYKLIMDFCKIA